MRRSGSEGSLLDPGVPLWRRHQLKEPPFHLMESDALRRPPEHSDTSTCASLPPIILELGSSPGGRSARLAREHSVSVEDLKELNKRDMDYLGVGTISEGLRAYSDGQLSQPSKGDGTQGENRTDHLPPHSTRADVSFKSHHHRLHARAKLSAAKLHIKGLFGQSYYPSNPTLSQEDQKDSVKEKRSRLLFMRQWSQVGHGRGLTFSGEELQKWGQSLNTLLASREGVSVFGGFLRSEFSEENLQFYLACEQYRQSSNNFSLQRRAKEICTTYIQPGSPREVNLDSKTRELTLQMLQAPSHTSLLQAQKLIYGLLDTDCYPRFLQSSLFHSLQQEAR